MVALELTQELSQVDIDLCSLPRSITVATTLLKPGWTISYVQTVLDERRGDGKWGEAGSGDRK